MPILIVAEDLIFLSKIRETAKQIGAGIEVTTPEKLNEKLAADFASAVICDLSCRPARTLEAVRELKRTENRVPLIGFVSHVQADLISCAREAGFDRVLARSAFTLQLPDILREYSRRDAPPSSHPSTGNAL